LWGNGVEFSYRDTISGVITIDNSPGHRYTSYWQPQNSCVFAFQKSKSAIQNWKVPFPSSRPALQHRVFSIQADRAANCLLWNPPGTGDSNDADAVYRTIAERKLRTSIVAFAESGSYVGTDFTGEGWSFANNRLRLESLIAMSWRSGEAC
jgi:hypothetical protein